MSTSCDPNPALKYYTVPVKVLWLTQMCRKHLIKDKVDLTVWTSPAGKYSLKKALNTYPTCCLHRAVFGIQDSLPEKNSSFHFFFKLPQIAFEDLLGSIDLNNISLLMVHWWLFLI